jgi:hypothetical protein
MPINTKVVELILKADGTLQYSYHWSLNGEHMIIRLNATGVGI